MSLQGKVKGDAGLGAENNKPARPETKAENNKQAVSAISLNSCNCNYQFKIWIKFDLFTINI